MFSLVFLFKITKYANIQFKSMAPENMYCLLFIKDLI
jgi:hypothetical protein